MQVNGKAMRTIRRRPDGLVEVIDQRLLPHRCELKTLASLSEAAHAISDMVVRGAPLIGATAAYGVAIALQSDAGDAALEAAIDTLARTRPTAVNLRWALDRMGTHLRPLAATLRCEAAFNEARAIADEDVAICEAIGDHGLALIRGAASRKTGGQAVNILTHCNAGWLATVDWGTALAPIYKARRAGLPVHVFVDETRPRNQGASLTAWELGQDGVPHTVIADNAGGHLMQHGLIDLCIVGTDRTTRTGDVANKIGTYLKALAAHDNGIPFYVALPSSTIDWGLRDGIGSIPIEERSPREVTHLTGKRADGEIETIQITPDGSPAANPAFDVTPARLVTALVTERGVCPATEAGLLSLFPEEAPRVF